MRKIIICFMILLLSFQICFASDLSGSALIDRGSMELKSVNVSHERISAEDSNGFKAIILELIGDYETVITDYVYQSYSGSTSHSISIEKDYAWIWSAIVLCISVYCVFRVIGGILCR